MLSIVLIVIFNDVMGAGINPITNLTTWSDTSLFVVLLPYCCYVPLDSH